MKIEIPFPRLLALFSALAIGPLPAIAQSAASPTGGDASPPDEEVVALSPFTVTASTAQDGYEVKDTLAGSRVRTDLNDLASSISVVNEQFLRDTAARNAQELLVYTPNTEIGGFYGNYAGVGNTFANGISEGGLLLRPNTNTRVRGLDSADETRDYFGTDIPWDVFNVGRIDLQRGPNSILFGVGSPAGVHNASVNTAGFATKGEVQNRLGSFGSLRTSVDYNQVLIKDELAVRIAALDDHTKYRQKPAFNRDRRVFGALRWEPQLFGGDAGRTVIRANFERGDVKANRPRVLPPTDQITPFFAADADNKRTYDPFYVWAGQAAPGHTPGRYGTAQNNPWLAFGGGGIITEYAGSPTLYYDNVSSATQPSTPTAGWIFNRDTRFAVGTDGVPDGGVILGIPNQADPLINLAGYSTYAFNVNRDWTGAPAANPFPAADKYLYKDRSITDTSIFDFYNHLLDGPNKSEAQGWTAYNLAVSQTFLKDRVGIELVYDRQSYHDNQQGLLSNPFISVDIAQNTVEGYGYALRPSGPDINGVLPDPLAWGYPDLVHQNPGVGRAFTGGNGQGGGSASFTERENVRGTVTGELNARDFLSNSKLVKILGHHRLTGLYSRETYDRETRSWTRFASESAASPVGIVVYLSGDLRSRSSASGLDLQPIGAIQSPVGAIALREYDSHWRPGNTVNPADPFTNPAPSNSENEVPNDLTQSENPRNYVGWVTNQHNILNADQGDLAKLYTDGSKTRTTTESNGLTLQSYFLDDILVGTVGWRRDTVKTRSARASSSSITGRVVSLNYQLDPLDPEIGVSKGESKTWGIVLHEPKAWRNKLPLGTRFSLFYDEGNNTRVQSRYSFTGDRLANPKGHTKDYGVVLNTLNDKLRLKITWYDTTVKDATLVGALAGVAQYITNIESVGTAAAMKDLAGIRGDDPGTNWYWNWAWANFDSNNALYGGITGPSSPGYAQWLADPTTVSELAIIKSWQDQMQPQSFWDAYDIPIDTAKVKAGDYMHAIGTWDPTQYVSTIPNTASLMINGVRPTATVDNRSKGIEYEVVAQPISGLTLSVNASKQAASQNALGAAFAAFIEAEYAKFQTPAGDLRMWWAGPGYANTFASWFDQVYASYLFQKQTIGREMPEMAPWRFNGVANYNFEKGALKGFNVGAAVRWDDRTLLGYLLNTTKDNLDVNRPVWASSETHIDLWAGYARKLTAKVDWRIQVNVRNVGESRGLRVLSVQPNDGSPAQYRIVEGATWYVTNTFSF